MAERWAVNGLISGIGGSATTLANNEITDLTVNPDLPVFQNVLESGLLGFAGGVAGGILGDALQTFTGGIEVPVDPEIPLGENVSFTPVEPGEGFTPAPYGVRSANPTEVNEAFHYTQSRWSDAIMEEGLRPGTYATPDGTLGGLQSQLELALPPNRALPNVRIQIDLQGLREAGYEIPSVSRVSGAVEGAGGRVYQMPGGGYEMKFPYPIPPQYLKVIPIP